MAIAGGACSAYRCRVIDGELVVMPTTTLRTLCVKLQDAVDALSRGEWVLLAGGDMAELRTLLGAEHANVDQ
jgi:hypothetical protein